VPAWRNTRVWVGVAISALFLVLLLRQVNGAELQAALANVQPGYLGLALLVYAVALWVRGLRWQLVLRPHVHVTPYEAFTLLVIGYAANNVLPVRAGEFVRAGLLQSRHDTPWTTGLGAIAVERVLDGLMLALFLSVTVLVAGGDALVRTLAGVAAGAFIAALLVMYALAYAGERGRRLVARLLHTIPGSLGARLARLADGMLAGLDVLREPALGVSLLLATALTWSLEAATYGLVGMAFDLGLSPLVYFGLCGAANLAIAAPSTSGGIGPFEFFAREVAVWFGAGTAVATAYALIVHALILVPVVLLGAALLWLKHLGLDALLRPRSQAAADESRSPVSVER
jgi:uncharacterized protein (TIRG00374 family)